MTSNIKTFTAFLTISLVAFGASSVEAHGGGGGGHGGGGHGGGGGHMGGGHMGGFGGGHMGGFGGGHMGGFRRRLHGRVWRWRAWAGSAVLGWAGSAARLHGRERFLPARAWGWPEARWEWVLGQG